MTANDRQIPTSVLFQLEIDTLDFESNTYDLLMTIGNPKDKITPITAATAGTANTGGGGGGAHYQTSYAAGGAGGSGLVIVRYLK